jgi:Fic family protein
MENAMITVAECAKKWGISERTVRNYCARQRIPGAVLKGKTWWIPASAERPVRQKKKDALPTTLLERLRVERQMQLHGGIYHKVQIDLTYNSNHMEGSRLTHEQTRYIFETNTIGMTDEAVNVDDIVETVNHFRCIDYIIDHAEEPITESMAKQLHLLLKTGTSDSHKDWFAVGDYKRLANEVGGQDTCQPKEVHRQMKALISDYHHYKRKTLENILDFHVRFERIHPFQDGNCRVGRLLMFKECLASDIVPFIITDDLKFFYYRGLREWGHIDDYLTDTCLTAQDQYKSLLDYFKIGYK